MYTMKRIIFYLMIAVVLFSFMVPTSIYAEIIVGKYNEKIPIEYVQPPAFIPCANGGLGDILFFSGYLHQRGQLVLDTEKGLVFISYQSNPMGAICIGMMTGDIYQATGMTRGTARRNIPPTVPYEETFINNFKIIGPGPGNNLLVHETVRLEVNAAGEVTVNVENIKIDCK